MFKLTDLIKAAKLRCITPLSLAARRKSPPLHTFYLYLSELYSFSSISISLSSILFYFLFSYSILFYSLLFLCFPSFLYSILFYSLFLILFSILYSLFDSLLFSSILYSLFSILYSIRFSSLLFYYILLYSLPILILSSSLLFSSLLFYFYSLAYMSPLTPLSPPSDLQQLCAIQETVKVKSGAWDEASGMFVYTTINHIKYLLPNGDAGIIRTLDAPLYLVAVKGNKCTLLDRDCKVHSVPVDITEAYFKMALFNKSFDTVLRMVREANLVGNAMVGYLQRKGHPDVALHFVKDAQVRFNLALECGQLDTALGAARLLEQPEYWSRLADAALAQVIMPLTLSLSLSLFVSLI